MILNTENVFQNKYCKIEKFRNYASSTFSYFRYLKNKLFLFTFLHIFRQDIACIYLLLVIQWKCKKIAWNSFFFLDFIISIFVFSYSFILFWRKSVTRPKKYHMDISLWLISWRPKLTGVHDCYRNLSYLIAKWVNLIGGSLKLCELCEFKISMWTWLQCGY